MNKLKSLSMMTILITSLLPFVAATVTIAAMDQEQPPLVQLMAKPGGGGSGQVADWGYVRIGADLARAATSGSVQVAVIDTGVDFDHPDLAGVVTWCYSAIARTEGCGTRDTNDDQGHGSHVIGTIAALDNNQDSVGIAAGHVEIYSIKALGRRGGDWGDLNHAIRMASDGPDGVRGTADDAEVISMSLGGDISNYPTIIADLQAAVDYATSNGVAVIASAGNEGQCSDAPNTRMSWPAASNGVVGVGATGLYQPDMSGWATEWTGAELDVMPCFSNNADYVDISAPGVYITATKNGGGTTDMSGTSMAAPHVAALVALLMANGFSASQAMARIYSTAIDMGYASTLQGAGLINAAAAV